MTIQNAGSRSITNLQLNMTSAPFTLLYEIYGYKILTPAVGNSVITLGYEIDNYSLQPGETQAVTMVFAADSDAVSANPIRMACFPLFFEVTGGMIAAIKVPSTSVAQTTTTTAPTIQVTVTVPGSLNSIVVSPASKVFDLQWVSVVLLSIVTVFFAYITIMQ